MAMNVNRTVTVRFWIPDGPETERLGKAKEILIAIYSKLEARAGGNTQTWSFKGKSGKVYNQDDLYDAIRFLNMYENSSFNIEAKEGGK